MTKYGNAEKILPKRVLKTIRQYFPKGMLWIPPDCSPGICETEVVRLYRKGFGSAEIAAKVQRSQRRVNQILKAYRSTSEVTQKCGNGTVLEPLDLEDISVDWDDLEQSMFQDN
jgi:hypothetical protein